MMNSRRLLPLLLALPGLFGLAACSSLPADNPDRVVALTWEMERGGRAEAAWELAEEAHRAWPGHGKVTAAWVELALRRATREGRYDYELLDRVEGWCREAAARGGVEDWYTLGEVRRRRGDLDGAVRAWQEGRKREAYHERTLRALAELHYSLGRESRAGSLYAELARIPPPRADVHYRLAVCRLATVERRHQVDPAAFRQAEVEALLKRCLEVDPNHAGAHRALAWLTIRLSRLRGRWSDPATRKVDAARARQHLERALKSDGRDAEALHGLGWLAQEGGREAEAERLFCRSLEVDPDCVPSLLDLAALLEGRGGRKEEVRALRERARRHTRDPLRRRALRAYRSRKLATRP